MTYFASISLKCFWLFNYNCFLDIQRHQKLVSGELHTFLGEVLSKLSWHCTLMIKKIIRIYTFCIKLAFCLQKLKLMSEVISKIYLNCIWNVPSFTLLLWHILKQLVSIQCALAIVSRLMGVIFLECNRMIVSRQSHYYSQGTWAFAIEINPTV